MPTLPQKQLIFSKLGYTPTEAQWTVHQSQARKRLVAGGERSGKSLVGAMELLSRFYEGKLYWLVAADYERTRAEFNYICDGLDKLQIDYHATRQVDPGSIQIIGGFRIATKSAKDPRKLAMEAPDGIIGCEASQLDWETYLRLQGRLLEKKGWLLLTGSFESSIGWYPELFNKGQLSTGDFASFSLPTWTNTVVFPKGREDPEILALEKACSKAWFSERFGGIPCPPTGTVFPEFRVQKHVGVGQEYTFDPIQPIYLTVDPGFQHFYAVEVLQKRGSAVYVVDEVYETGLVTSDIIKICKGRPWWNRAHAGYIDVAARQHQGMPAVSEVWAAEAGISLQSQRVPIIDGIERLKSLLQPSGKELPELFIHNSCQGLISELGGCPQPGTGRTAVYQWRVDREGRVIGDVPDDKHNDAVKALIYGVVGLCGYTEAQRRTKIKFF